MIKSFTLNNTSDSILSRICLVSLIWLLLILGGFSSRAWGDPLTTTLVLCGDKKSQNSIQENGITFKLGGTYSVGGSLADYNYTGSGNSFRFSWIVPTGYTINVSKLTIDARRYWGTTGNVRGYYKTKKKMSPEVKFIDTSDAWKTYTLDDASYFGLGNTDTIFLRVENKELDYRNATFYYTKTANTYTISFNGNGSTKGSTASVSATYDQNVTLAANGYRKHQYIVTYDVDGGSALSPDSTLYTFLGWNKKTDGSGDNYSAGATLTTPNFTSTQGATFPLYAKWSAAVASASITLPTPTRDGYLFEGWYVGSIAPANKITTATYTPTANVTLVANWVGKYDFTITGDDYTIDNEAWNKTTAFTFVHADEANMTTTIQNTDVISYNRASNTISALKIGTSKITFTQNTSTTVKNGTIVFTITVDSVANTLAVSGTSYTKYVEQEVTSVRSAQNSDGTISTTSSNYNLAHYDIANNKIVIPNSDAQELPFDDVTITISQAPTAKYKAKKHTITLTVQKYTSSINGTLGASNLMVDGSTSIGSYTTSNVEAGDPAEGDSNNYYYTISHSLPDGATTTGCATGHSSHVIGFDPSAKAITAYNAGSATLTITQKETYRYTGFTKSFTVTVYKYNNSFTATANYNKKVEETQVSDYVWTYTKPNADYPGAANHDAGTPGEGSESGNFYYTINHAFPEDAITTGCPSEYLSSIISYNASTQTATARNAGVATVTLHQKETYKYKAATNSFTVTVTKWANPLNVVGAANHWTANIYPDKTWTGKELRSINNNADYTTFPISVEQYAGNTPGEEIMTYEYNQSTRMMTFHSNYRLGTAKWRFTQPESYKYVAGEDSIRLTVVHAPEATCYVLSEVEDWEKAKLGDICHEHTWGYENAAGVLTFKVRRDAAPIDNYVIVQEKIAGIWYDKKKFDDYGTSEVWRSVKLTRSAKGVRFFCSGSVYNYVMNVSVKRDTYLEEEDTIRVDKTAALNPVYPIINASDVPGASQLIIAHSLANGGNLKIANDNPKFTLSESTITNSDCSAGKDTISITYVSSVAGNDTAHLIVYNDVYRDTVVLIGTTVKHDQIGSWKDNIAKLTKGTKVVNAYSSTMSGTYGVTYTVLSGTSVTVKGDTLVVVESAGTTRIRAYVPGDAIYKEIADTIDITATSDYLQFIVWDQDFTHLEIDDDNIPLTAYADSEVESDSTNGAFASCPRPITYSIKAGERTDVVDFTDGGRSLIILGTGQTTIVATQAGGTDGDKHVAYAPISMEKTVVVRESLLKLGCSPDTIYNYLTDAGDTDGDADEYRFELSYNWSELYYVIDFGGKEPGYYTFQYKGQTYQPVITKYLDGHMSVEQYVEGEWVNISGALNTLTESNQSIYYTASGTFDRLATKMRIKAEGVGYHYFKELRVRRAEYLGIVEDEEIKDTLKFDTYISTPQAKDLVIRVSNMEGPIQISLPENAPFTLSTEEAVGTCGTVVNTDLRITYNSEVEERHSYYNLVLANGYKQETIVLDATTRPDTCTFTSNGNWESDDELWTKYPNENLTAVINEGVEITITGKVSAYALTIKEGAKVTIAATGGLTVGAGGIKGATETNLTVESATGKTGYLRMSPKYKGATPSARVEMFLKAYKDVAAGDTKWQYVGSPVKSIAASSVFSYLYNWYEETGSWKNKRSSTTLEPFKGYAATQKTNAEGVTVVFTGELVTPETKTVALTYTESSANPGCNVVANSFAAPIDISRLTPDDFPAGAEATINFFNAGSKADLTARELTKAVDVEAPGQYIPVPVRTARVLHSLSNYPIVIPSMQGFYVNTTAAGNLTLDYERLVWEADYDKAVNQPLRVGERKTANSGDDELSGTLKITLTAQNSIDHLIMIESEEYDAAYENGYDARKIMSDELNIFAIEDEDELAIDATNSIIGTHVGVRTGEETAYTLLFSRVNGEAVALYDSETEQTIDINEGTQYTFFAEPNAMITERFEIVARADAPAITTGVDKVENGAKVHKFIKGNQLFILKNGVLYNATGAVVR